MSRRLDVLTLIVIIYHVFLNQVRMFMEETAALKKFKTTIYMSQEDEERLNELFIKRIKSRNRTDKSALLCEGVRLLYEKEVKDGE